MHELLNATFVSQSNVGLQEAVQLGRDDDVRGALNMRDNGIGSRCGSYIRKLSGDTEAQRHGGGLRVKRGMEV